MKTDPIVSSSRSGAVYLLDKCSGLTSRKASGKVAEYWKFRHYGHSGTLDPAASGLLLILLGKATRLSRFLTDQRKEYEFLLVLGIETDTCDDTGSIVKQCDSKEISRDQILEVLPMFTGNIRQRAPLFSAVRIKGKRAYELARKGIKMDMPFRDVEVFNWHVGEIEDRTVKMTVSTGPGTFIRALARDIGREFGTGAIASSIRRLATGSFRIEEASRTPDNQKAYLSMSEVMRRDYKEIIVNCDQKKMICHGISLPGQEKGIIPIIDNKNNLIAVGRGNGKEIKPECVLQTI